MDLYWRSDRGLCVHLFRPLPFWEWTMPADGRRQFHECRRATMLEF